MHIVDIGFAFDALRCYLIDPRQHNHWNESNGEQQNDGARCGRRRAEFRQQRCQHFGEQPADDEVCRGYAEYVAPLQFAEKRHGASLANMAVLGLGPCTH